VHPSEIIPLIQRHVFYVFYLDYEFEGILFMYKYTFLRILVLKMVLNRTIL
jgi:hypothetical protein